MTPGLLENFDDQNRSSRNWRHGFPQGKRVGSGDPRKEAVDVELTSIILKCVECGWQTFADILLSTDAARITKLEAESNRITLNDEGFAIHNVEGCGEAMVILI